LKKNVFIKKNQFGVGYISIDGRPTFLPLFISILSILKLGADSGQKANLQA